MKDVKVEIGDNNNHSGIKKVADLVLGHIPIEFARIVPYEIYIAPVIATEDFWAWEDDTEMLWEDDTNILTENN